MWIRTSASSFCSFCASYLHKKAPKPTVARVVEQIYILRKLKRIGTVLSYPGTPGKSEYILSVLAFSDACKAGDCLKGCDSWDTGWSS